MFAVIRMQEFNRGIERQGQRPADTSMMSTAATLPGATGMTTGTWSSTGDWGSTFDRTSSRTGAGVSILICLLSA